MPTRTAVILAAGIGSRLRPLTDDRPKALVPVRGRSILQRAVSALASHGVDHLVIATGYREDAIVRALEHAPMKITYRRNPDFERTQNSVSLALCRDVLEDCAFLRLDGDLVFDAEILSRLDDSTAPLAAAVDRERALDGEAMKVELDGGRILRFGKGIPLERAFGESIGIERVSGELSGPLFVALDRARAAGETGLYYEDVYSRLIAAGHRAEAVDVSGLVWCEIDSADDLQAAESLLGP